MEINRTFPRLAVLVVATALLVGSCTSSAHDASEVERIVEVLGLEPGMEVADVGAGDGEWSEALAVRVGETGHVYATEVKEDLVEEIRERAEDAGLSELITPLLGSDLDTGLDERCCDAILLRLVYHHFTDPEAMRASLTRALRPGGTLVVIDLLPQEDWRELPGVPDRGGHGIPPETLIEELVADGYKVTARYDDWNGEEDRYCVVFRAPA